MLLSILSAFLLAASGDLLSFDSVSHDFGSQPKTVSSLVHEFRFTNNSQRSLSVSYAVSTCSCTKLSWTTGKVGPGQEGFVRAEYFRERSADSFEKFISVFVEGVPKPYVLRIAGSFHETESGLAKEFPYRLSDIGFASSVLNAGEAYAGTRASDSFWVANFSNEPLTVSFSELSDGLAVSPDYLRIDPQSRVRFTYFVDVDSLVWGRRLYAFTPVADGKPLDKVSLALTVTQDFSALSDAEKNAGPLPLVLDRSCTFGTVRSGRAAKAAFKIQNASDAPLRVLAAFSDYDGIKVDAPSVIPPRETASFSVSLAPSVLAKGENSFKIQVLSNSPLMQIVEVYVKGNVE